MLVTNKYLCNRILYPLSFFVLVLFISTNAKSQNNSMVDNQSETTLKKILPTDDTYVYGMNNNASDIIRGLDDPYVLKSYFYPPSYTFDIHLKFDLSSLTRNTEWIESVKLRMYGSDAYGSIHTLELFEKSGTDWDEENLTFAALGNTGSKNKIGSIKVNMGTSQWYDWDITEFIKSCKTTNKNVISLMLCDSVKMKQSDLKTSVYAIFDSKENESGNTPHLEVYEQQYSELLLQEVTVNGILLEDFDQVKFAYNILLPANVAEVPMISAVPANSSASITYDYASMLTGKYEDRTTFIDVTIGEKSIQYSVTFEIAPLNNDAQVANITLGDASLDSFDKTKHNYNYYFPYTYSSDMIPEIRFLASNPNQQITVLPVSNLTGTEAERTCIVRVKSGDLSTEQDYTITFEILPELDLYLCIGQSNMAGRGYINESLGDLDPINNTYLFTPDLSWEIASNPMNKYSSKRKDMRVQRISPAYGFAINVKDKVAVPIGMVVNAKGASTITHWTKGNAEGLYAAAIIRAQEAQKWGRFKAILWHQGEGDSGSGVSAYPTRLRALVDNLRADLNEPDLYFVAGELAYWRGGGNGSTAFNNMIQTIASFVPNSDYISSEGTIPLINEADPHFDRESNILLGKRYADKVLEKIYGISSSNSETSLNKPKISIEKKSMHQ